jgi:hypothetical protein
MPGRHINDHQMRLYMKSVNGSDSFCLINSQVADNFGRRYLPHSTRLHVGALWLCARQRRCSHPFVIVHGDGAHLSPNAWNRLTVAFRRSLLACTSEADVLSRGYSVADPGAKLHGETELRRMLMERSVAGSKSERARVARCSDSVAQL